MKERAIEAAHVERVEGVGGKSYKFVSPNCSGVPDRLDLYPIANQRHREIVARYFRFTELKAPRKKPDPRQIREHAEIRALGFTVDVLDHKK